MLEASSAHAIPAISSGISYCTSGLVPKETKETVVLRRWRSETQNASDFSPELLS